MAPLADKSARMEFVPFKKLRKRDKTTAESRLPFPAVTVDPVQSSVVRTFLSALIVQLF
ncbi:hypothetical protein Poly59_42390 [Rubripirellula reticaptiva]|uniref:Uncharacterized protein n=1 Tax=Rubripirellula reticaptiva TaxID=2528013 RepID=A0A5C6ENE4_9BACT|nr:hypothetical protein Poly59_42390 [Rubripirellula reticaptiva]